MSYIPVKIMHWLNWAVNEARIEENPMKMANFVVLFVVDGLRPDGLKEADTPCIDNLANNGAYTFNARTVMPSVTLPCITSMFLGTEPKHHGIITNTWKASAQSIPSIIDLVHLEGMTASSFYNWEPLRDLSKPGSLNASFFLSNSEDPQGDLEIARLAAEYLLNRPTSFTFIYLGHTDAAGHKYGWMTNGYLEAVEKADTAIERVLDAIDRSGTAGETVFIVTSDHGGHEKTHGTDMPEDLIVPWIVSGSGIRSKLELREHVSIIDTAPTIAALLGIKQPKEWTGRIISQIFRTGR